MSAPFLWIIIPGLAAAVLFFLRRWEKQTHLIGVLLALALAWLAWALPIGESIRIQLWEGMPVLRVAESATFLGVRFTLNDAIRPLLVMLYLSAAFWFGGAFSARAGSLLVPIGFGMVCLLAAALAVTPSTHSALIIELAALLCVPLFAPPGNPIQRGVSLFLTFQITGMGIVLLVGWSLAMAAQQGSGLEDLSLGILALGVGYALTLGIVPFHSWIPMTAGEAHPYAAGFVYFLLPSAIFFLLLDTLIRYTATPVSSDMYLAIRTCGALMALGGGLWAAFENHLGRLFGFAAMHQIGMVLLLLSLNEFSSPAQPLSGLFFANLLPQAIAFAVWAQALSRLRREVESPQVGSLHGLARRMPLVSTALVGAIFSLAGLPLLASFPVYLPVWSVLAGSSLWLAIMSLLGCIFLFSAGLRCLSSLFSPGAPESWRLSEDRLQLGLLLIGLLALGFIGLFPGITLPYLTEMASQLSSPFP